MPLDLSAPVITVLPPSGPVSRALQLVAFDHGFKWHSGDRHPLYTYETGAVAIDFNRMTRCMFIAGRALAGPTTLAAPIDFSSFLAWLEHGHSGVIDRAEEPL